MNHIAVSSPPSTSSPLRRVLALNASTSMVAGLAAAVARRPVADLLGLDGARSELVVLLVGLGLVVFAVDVVLTALRTNEATLNRNAGLIAVADIGWVVATVVVLATVEMSGTGQLIAVAMGLGVAGFAGLQLRLR